MEVTIEYHICKEGDEWEPNTSKETETHETDHFETFVESVMDAHGATELSVFDDDVYAFIDMGLEGISITVD